MSDTIFRKPLDQDCLLGGKLHPSVALRLQRIRELPVSAAANLYGVEATADGATLLWQFIPGETIEAFLRTDADVERRRQVAMELEAAVASVHAHGIVHGAIHARNVVVDRAGRVRLIHFSPLLWSDERCDDLAVRDLTQELVGEGSLRSNTAGISDDQMLRRALHRRALRWACVAAAVGAVCLVAAWRH